jgi:polysaccharide pyruvyl transferase WcaK-like protein
MGGAGRSERAQAFVQLMARAVRTCAVEFGARVTFLPLWPGRDDEVMRAVSGAAAALGVAPTLLSWPDEDAGEPARIAAVIGGADLLVSMRLHALIFAACGGVPFLALAYARKVRGLARTLGAERWLVEVENRMPEARDIETKLRQLWESREQQSAALTLAARDARLRADQDADSIAGLLQDGRWTMDDGRSG